MIEYNVNITEHGTSVCRIRFWELIKEHELMAWCEMGWPCDLGALPEELRNEASMWSGACQQESEPQSYHSTAASPSSVT